MFRSNTKRRSSWDHKSARAKERKPFPPIARSFRPSLERLEDRTLLSVNWANLVQRIDIDLTTLADPSQGIGAVDASNQLPVFGATPSALLAQPGTDNPVIDLKAALDGALSNPSDNADAMQMQIGGALEGNHFLDGLTLGPNVPVSPVYVKIGSDSSASITLQVNRDVNDGRPFQTAFGLALPAVPLSVDGNVVTAKIGLRDGNLQFRVDGHQGNASSSLATDTFHLVLDGSLPNINTTLNPGASTTGKVGLLPVTVQDEGTHFQFDFGGSIHNPFPTLFSFDTRLSTPAGLNQVQLQLTTNGQLPDFPVVNATFNMTWSFSNVVPGTLDPTQFGSLDQVSFDGIQLDPSGALQGKLRNFIDNYLAKFTVPAGVQKVLRVLESPVPILSNLSEALHGGPIKLIDVLVTAAGGNIDISGLEALLKFADDLSRLENDVSSFTAPIHFGNFDVKGSNTTDLRLISDSNQVSTGGPASSDFGNGGAGQDFDNILAQLNTNDQPNVGFHLSFNLLNDPSQGVFKLLLRQPADLFEINGGFNAPFGFDVPFPIIPPILTVGFSGQITPIARFDLGFDTAGFQSGNIDDGFWVGGGTGFGVTGRLDAYGSLNIVVAKAEVHGGLEVPDGTDDQGLHPIGFFFPGSPGTRLRAPLPAFQFRGQLNADLGIDLKVGVTILGNFIGWEKTFDIAHITLINFGSPTTEDQQPHLANLDADGTLHLFMGPLAGNRNNVADPNPNNPDGEPETFNVYPGVVREDGNLQGINLPGGGYVHTLSDDQLDPNTTVTVGAFQAREFFTGVTKIVADGGQGSNTVTIEPGVKASADLFGGYLSTDSTLSYLGESTDGGTVRLAVGSGPSKLTSDAAKGETDFVGGYGDPSGSEIQDLWTVGGNFNVVQPDAIGRNLTVVVQPQAPGSFSSISGGIYTSGSTNVEIQGPAVPTRFLVTEGTDISSADTQISIFPQGQSASGINIHNVNQLIVEGLSAADTITVNADRLQDSGLNELDVSVTHLSPFETAFYQLRGIPLPVNTVIVNTPSGDDQLQWHGGVGLGDLLGVDLSNNGGVVGTHLQVQDLDSGDSFQVHETSGHHQVSFDDILWPTLIDGGDAGTTNDVRVAAVDAPLTVDGQNSATDVWLGYEFFVPTANQLGMLSGIHADVTVRNASLTLDDGADIIGLLARMGSDAFTRYGVGPHGLFALPGVVHFDGTVTRLDLQLGAGSTNGITVLDTPAAPTTVEGGSGSIGVYATYFAGLGPLSILNGFFQILLGDPVTHSMANIASDITVDNSITGFDTLVADDSSDTTTRNVTLAPEAYPYYAMSGLSTRTVYDPFGGSHVLPVTLHLGHIVHSTINTGTPSGQNSTVRVKNTPYDSPVDFELGGNTDVTVGDDAKQLATNTDLTVHANAGGDSLTLNDQGNPLSARWRVGPSAISQMVSFGILGTSAIIDYRGFFSVTVNGGRANNQFTVSDTSAPAGTTIYTGPGNSTTTVNATTGSLGIVGQGGHDSVTLVGVNGGDHPTPASLQNITQQVSVENLGGSTNLVADDSADATARTVTIDPRSIVGLAPATIFYGPGVAALTVDGGYGGNTIGVQNTAAATNSTVNSGIGLDVVYVWATTGPLTVNTQQGNAPGGGVGFDAVLVGARIPNVGYTLDTIQGDLIVNTVGGYGDLFLYDTATITSEQFSVTSDRITRSGMAPIQYLISNELAFYLGSGGNSVTVQSTEPGLPTVFTGGLNHDTFNVGDAANTMNGIQGHLTFYAANPGSQVFLHDEGNTANMTYTIGSTMVVGPNGGLVPAGTVLRSDVPWSVFLLGPLQIVQLKGGSGNDKFNVQSLLPDINTTAELVGGSGNNTLAGPDVANTWVLTGANQGRLDRAISFASMANLTGGASTDAFQFVMTSATPIQPATFGSLTGQIDGGGGVNTLDYSAYQGDTLVDLLLHNASLVGQGVSSIANVTGSRGNDLIVGDANPNVLVGGTGRNVIVGDGGADTITGGGGFNLLIGGITSYDNNLLALQDLMQYWDDPAATTLDQLVNPLKSKNGVTVNGQLLMISKVTVQNDNAADSLIAGSGANWFVAGSDGDTINNGTGPGPNDRLTRI